MADPRALDAIHRIERALARIEAAAASPRPSPETTEELERLRQAHEALRERVSGAVGQIDRLLASAEQA